MPKFCVVKASKDKDVKDVKDYGWRGSILDISVITKDANTSPILVT